MALCDNGLTHNQILNQSKLKAFPDDNLNLPQMTEFVSWVENILGKGENASYQNLLLFSKMFLKGFILQGG